MVEVKPDSGETLRFLDRIRSGERAAFDSLFARHRLWLRRLVELRFDGRLQARVDPSDVVQETQLEAFRRLTTFLDRQPMPFRLWLRKTLDERLRMVERQHLGAARRAVRRERLMPDAPSTVLGAQLAGSDPSPSEQLGQRELSRQVREALAGLEDQDREILLMRTFEALSYTEVAYILEIDPAAARKRHGRALVRLHQILSSSGLTESQV